MLVACIFLKILFYGEIIVAVNAYNHLAVKQWHQIKTKCFIVPDSGQVCVSEL